MIDTFNPLYITSDAKKCSDKKYPLSWNQ